MVDIPVDFIDGQELEADDLNKIIATRTGDIKPIDDTTREYTDNAGALGSATYRYTEAHIDNIEIDGNTISSTTGDVEITSAGDINLTPNGTGAVIIGNRPTDEIGATLVVSISGYTKTYYQASTGWYVLELKGAGGSNTGTPGDASDGGYLKDIFYVPYPMVITCIGSTSGNNNSGIGGGSSVVYSPMHEYICGGGAGNVAANTGNGGHDSPSQNNSSPYGLGGRYKTYFFGYTSGISTGTYSPPAGGNSLNSSLGGGATIHENGSVKLWKVGD